MYYLKQLTFLCFFTNLLFSCSNNESVIPKEQDPLERITSIEKIRDQNKYLNTSDIPDDFNISEIDFTEHIGLSQTGVSLVNLSRKGGVLTLGFSSSIPKWNKTSMTLSVENNVVKSNWIGNSMIWNMQNDDVEFELEGSSFDRNSLSEETAEENPEISVLFKVPVYVSFAIRELSYKHYLDKMDLQFFEENAKLIDSNPNARVENTKPYCEYFPSIYMEDLAWTSFTAVLEMHANLDARCSNEYCIGCCNKYIEPQCVGYNTICVIMGYGFQCDDYPHRYGDDVNPDHPNAPLPM